MLRLLLSLEEPKRPNRMAGVAPWAIIIEALAAKGMCFADHLIYFWNNNFLGRHYTAQNCYDKWATLMKKYKKILLKLEKSGTGSVEWDFLSDMKELNMSNHVINPVAPHINTPKVVKEEAASRSILINLRLSANTLFYCRKTQETDSQDSSDEEGATIVESGVIPRFDKYYC